MIVRRMYSVPEHITMFGAAAGMVGAVYPMIMAHTGGQGFPCPLRTLTGVPCPVSWAANRLDVFGKGTDDALYHKAFSGSWGGWEDLGGIIAA